MLITAFNGEPRLERPFAKNQPSIRGEAPSSDRSSSGERQSDTAPQTEMNFGKSKPAAD